MAAVPQQQTRDMLTDIQDLSAGARFRYAAPANLHVVKSRRETLPLRNPTTCSGPLADAALKTLKTNFAAKNHHPSPEMWSALSAILTALEEMADGTASPSIHLASLDPGVGKTQAVIAFLRALLTSEHHRRVSALVCVGRLAQIEEVIRDAELPAGSYAVFTSDKDLNALGTSEPSQARVLFTTHSMVESRCEGHAFADVTELHYQDHPRDVRVWDEAILPGRTLTISRDDIASLLKPVRRHNPRLAVALDTLQTALLNAETNTQHVMPDLEREYEVDLNGALRMVEGATADQQAAVDGLWFLSGKVVTVRRDGAFGNTILDYRETLPADVAPLLVLDASARVRATYQLWEEYRGGIVRLPAAAKDYSPLTINVWSTPGGKSAFKRNGDRLIEGIINTINRKPNEPWLVVYHKGVGRDIERELSRQCPGVELRFLNWGRHDATNAFAAIPNIILAGTLFYRPSYYESLARLASNRPSASGNILNTSFNEVVKGEHSHLILQALCRGAVRKCQGASCPKTDAYIIASNGSGIAHELPVIFPGSRVCRWQPVATDVKGKAGQALAFIRDTLAGGADDVPFAAVKKHTGVTNAANFKKNIRRHPALIEALAEDGIIEWPEVRPTRFTKASAAYFGNTDE